MSSRLIFSLALLISFANAGAYISTTKEKNSFTLFESGKTAPLVISGKDFAGVKRVAGHLQNDIFLVTGTKPEIISDSLPQSKEIILIGTFGNNPLIDKLVQEKKIDVTDIAGKWETFLIQTVENPFPNIERALVIAGSDKRGTIFGMFNLSENIGVSPWYWWADVPVKKKSSVYVLPTRHTLGEPKVKYRGIFINDEAPALTGWLREKFGTDLANHKFYQHVFELILRLKGNFLWPAMWPPRAFYDNDPENPRLADEYGIVISTSHHEPMMCAHAEWEKYHKGEKWNYEKNDSTLREFWREGIKRMGNYESVVTLAMRGDGDEPMSEGANVALLEKIVKDQRQILGEVTKKDVTTIPQVWALYKEVQEYYDKGMRVPDDVTLLLCDNNWGNIRKLPALNVEQSEKPRAGGYGIYYHFDFVGGPRNYKWINTTQIERVWEQMRLAYEYNAHQIWVVNVGDIKPMEFPIDFFLEYAWNPEKISANDLPEFYRAWAEEQFGAQYANEIAEIIAKYTKFNSRRKPEMLDSTTFSLTHYREAERVVEEYNALVKRAEEIQSKLPAEFHDAFFQLVLHPAKAYAIVQELHVTTGKNHLYFKQRRAATNDLAARVKNLFDEDSLITHYYNNILAGGKWKHQMDQTHIGYTYWQQPEFNAIPKTYTFDVPNVAEMGIAIEGSENIATDGAILPELTPYSPAYRTGKQKDNYIEIFNRGKIPFDYSVTTGKPWLLVSKKRGKVEKEERIFVSVDFAKAPKGEHRVPITISGAKKSKVTVYAVVKIPAAKDISGFVQSNGYVSIEAENFSRAVGEWQKVENLGRTGSAIIPASAVASVETPYNDSPHLEYDIYLSSKDSVTVSAYLSPTINFHGKELRYAVSIDDAPPQIVSAWNLKVVHEWKYPLEWNLAVGNNILTKSSKHFVASAGKHTLKFWLVDAGVVLQKIVVETSGVQPSYLGPPESVQVK